MNSHPITRRTAVTGAAWSVPAVAVAAAAPAHASSVTFMFDSPTYAGCDVIFDVSLRTSGSLTGQTITLTLSAGYTFSGSGTSVTTVTASASGVTTCPWIKTRTDRVPGTVTATVAGHLATAQLSASPQTATTLQLGVDGSYYRITASGSWAEDVIPLGGAFSFVGTSLYRLSTMPHATEVVEAYGYSHPDGTDSASFVTASGFACTVSADRMVETHFSVPANSTPLGASFFLAGTDLYHRDNRVVSDVAAAHGYFSLTDGAALATVIGTDGSAALLSTTDGTVTARTAVPLNATPLAGDYYLAGTDLYYGNTRIAQNIRTAVAYLSVKGTEFHADCTTTTGAAILATPAGITTSHAAVPLHSTPIGSQFFLAEETLYQGNAIHAHDVLRAHGSTTTHHTIVTPLLYTATYVSGSC